MGQHIRAICQRRVDGKWRHLLHIPVSPVRLDWYTYPQFDFLMYDGFVMGDGSIEWESEPDDYAIARERGCPEDFDIHQWESVEFWDPVINDEVKDVDLPWDGYSCSWLTLEELVNHDYDRIVTRHGETKPLREFLTEQFIQMWRDAHAAGAERVVFSWS